MTNRYAHLLPDAKPAVSDPSAPEPSAPEPAKFNRYAYLLPDAKPTIDWSRVGELNPVVADQTAPAPAADPAAPIDWSNVGKLNEDPKLSGESLSTALPVTESNPPEKVGDKVARALSKSLKDDSTFDQEKAVRILDQDRDGFDPAQWLKDHPNMALDPLFSKTVLEVYKARSREGLIASRVIDKIPEALVGKGTEGYGLAGQIGSGIVGQVKNIGTVVATPGTQGDGERALAAKKVAASTVTAVGGMLDQLRTANRKLGDATPLNVVNRAINWAVTPGAPAGDILKGSGGPTDDAGWQARLDSDVSMLHRMDAAAKGVNLPGAPLSAADAAEVQAMSTVDPVTLLAGAGLAKAAGLVGKAAAIPRLAKLSEAAVLPSLTPEQQILRTMAARSAGPTLTAERLTAEALTADAAATKAANTASAVKAADVAATAAGTGPLVPRVAAVLNTPLVKSTLTAGALTGLSEKDEQAAAMAGLGAAGVVASGLSTGKRNLPIVVEGANVLEGAANLVDRAGPIAGKVVQLPLTVGGAVLGSSGGPLGSVGGALGGAVVGKVLKRVGGAVIDKGIDVVRTGAEKVSDAAAVRAYEIKKAAGVLEGEDGLYRLPSEDVLRITSETYPDRGASVAKEFELNKTATLGAIAKDPLAIKLVDPKLIDAMAFEQPILLNRTLEVLVKTPLEQLLGFDPLQSIKPEARKVSSAQKELQTTVDRQAGPLRRPAGAFMPLTTEVLPDGTGVVVGFGKTLIDATVRKVFEDTDLKAEFINDGLINPEGTKITQRGAEYLLRKFDEANAMQLDDIGPDGSVTRVFKSAKDLLTNITKERDAVKATQDAAKALMNDLKYEQKRLDLGHASRSRGHATSDLKLKIQLDKANAELAANKSVRDPLAPDATAARLILEQKIEGFKAEKGLLDQAIAAEADAKRTADSINQKGIADSTNAFEQAKADIELLNANLVAYGDLKMIGRLGILDVVPERVPLSKIQSTTRLPGSAGSPIGNKAYRDGIKQLAEDMAKLRNSRAALSIRAAGAP